MNMLIFVEGSQKGQRYPVDQSRLSLGRERHNDIPIDDTGASRNHISIESISGRVTLQDLGSTNGTFVNSKRVKSKIVLHNGDRITIGDTTILFESTKPTPTPKILVSDAIHDTTADVTVEMDSTVFLSPDSIAAMKAETQNQLLSLFNFITRITGVLDMDRLLPLAAKEMANTLKADRGAILFLNKSEELVPKATYPQESGDVIISRTITDNVLSSRHGILSSPGKGNPQLRETVSISQRDVGSVVCAPLMIEDKLLGVAYFDTKITNRNFDEKTLHMLSAMAMQFSITVQNAHLYRSMRNAEEFGSCILKSIGSGLFVTDRRGVVIRANDAACQILDVTQKDFVGMPMAGVPQLRELSAMVEQTRANGIPLDRTELMVNIGNRQVPLGVSTSILEDYTGKSIGAVCTFRDLTRLKKLADEVKRSQRLASLGEMAAGIAHEIRNPLNSVYGFAQLLQEGANERGCKTDMEYAQIVIEEVARINGIVQDMLDFSRQRDITMSTIHIKDLVEDLLKLVREDASLKNVNLSLNIPGGFAPVVMGNEDKLKQLFLNVIRNGCQACADGGNVKLEIEPVDDALNIYPQVAIRVRDDGCGIPSDVLDKVFNPFFTTKDVGTGLGLSICQKIVESHSGRIEVESAPGLGSTFTVLLPASERK